MASEEAKIFFSYARREDSEFALRLAQDLRAAGVDIWMDQLDIPTGVRWDHAIERALRACRGVLVILSPASAENNNVMDEVSYALDEGKQVLPVLHRACIPPYRLRRLQYSDFTTDYEKGLTQLLNALDADEALPREEEGASEEAEEEAPRLDGEPQSERSWIRTLLANVLLKRSTIWIGATSVLAIGGIALLAYAMSGDKPNSFQEANPSSTYNVDSTLAAEESTALPRVPPSGAKEGATTADSEGDEDDPTKGETTGEAKIFTADQVDRQPEPVGGAEGIYQRIRYPEAARVERAEGTVYVQVTVDEEGNVQSAEVQHPVRSDLDREALRVVRGTEFEPGWHDGKPVKVRMSLPVTFNLPTGPVPNPLDIVREELQDKLEKAVVNRNWSDVPSALTDHYKEVVDGLRKFDIKRARVESGSPAQDDPDGSKATMPVMLRIFAIQKGRDEPVDTVSVPATWIWERGTDGTWKLVRVQRET